MNDRIANAFRYPFALTEADCAELVALWKREAATAGKRRHRFQNTGGTDGKELERNKASRQRRAELRALKTAWG